MIEMRQPIASATKEIVPLMFLAVLSDVGVTVCPAHDANVERAHVGVGLCASGVDVATAF